MVKRVLWLLNFDAELELAAPTQYRASTKMLSNMADLEARFVRPADEEFLDYHPGIALPEDLAEARAWCPTPSALRRLADAGFATVRSPGLGVLQRVNHRAFAARLDPCLPGAFFSTNAEEVLQHLADAEPRTAWLLKRPYGFSSRMRKRVTAACLSAAEERWIAASMQDYGIGLQVEPFVQVLADFALHGLVREDAGLELGTPTRQVLDDKGVWQESRRIEAAELRSDEEEALRHAGEVAGRALASEAYFGPFNVDAYRWRDAQGNERFHSLSEINVRYSMGWYIGMAAELP